MSIQEPGTTIVRKGSIRDMLRKIDSFMKEGFGNAQERPIKHILRELQENEVRRKTGG